jgi:hypothetical protein
MPVDKVMFPTALIELNREVAYHPDLVEILSKQESPDLEVRLAEIAAYCEIILDGFYTQDDISRIADECIRRLKSKRVGIILLH